MIVLQGGGDLKLLVFQLDKEDGEDGVCASEDVDTYSQRGVGSAYISSWRLFCVCTPVHI
jgi:hypothetical protein